MKNFLTPMSIEAVFAIIIIIIASCRGYYRGYLDACEDGKKDKLKFEYNINNDSWQRKPGVSFIEIIFPHNDF